MAGHLQNCLADLEWGQLGDKIAMRNRTIESLLTLKAPPEFLLSPLRSDGEARRHSLNLWDKSVQTWQHELSTLALGQHPGMYSLLRRVGILTPELAAPFFYGLAHHDVSKVLFLHLVENGRKFTPQERCQMLAHPLIAASLLADDLQGRHDPKFIEIVSSMAAFHHAFKPDDPPEFQDQETLFDRLPEDTRHLVEIIRVFDYVGSTQETFRSFRAGALSKEEVRQSLLENLGKVTLLEEIISEFILEHHPEIRQIYDFSHIYHKYWPDSPR